MYIITNCTPNGDYTPSIVNTIEEAKAWMRECTADNIRAAFEDECEELWEMTEDEVFSWAEDNITCRIHDRKTEIYYDDDSYNIMEIFEIEGEE